MWLRFGLVLATGSACLTTPGRHQRWGQPSAPGDHCVQGAWRERGGKEGGGGGLVPDPCLVVKSGVHCIVSLPNSPAAGAEGRHS